MSHPLRAPFPGLLLSLACLMPLAASAQTLVYGTDFEAPRYTLGPAGDAYGLPNSGQDGWRTSPRAPYSVDPSPWVLISDARAYSGSQALQLVMDPSFYNGVNGYGAYALRDFSATPIVLNSLTDAFSITMKVYLDQAPTSDLGWTLSMNTGGIYALGMTLQSDNRVAYGHSLMNQGQTFTPGFDLHNRWLTLRLERDAIDYTSLRLSLSAGGQSWSQQVTSPGGSMPYVSFGGVIPTFPVSPYGVATIDDVRIGYNLPAVPEPATWSLWLAAAGIALARLRPRRA